MRSTAVRLVLASLVSIVTSVVAVAQLPSLEQLEDFDLIGVRVPSGVAELEAALPEAEKREAEASAKLQTQALDWLKAHNAEKNPDSELVTNMAEPLKKITEGRHNFAIMMGSALTDDKMGYFLCGWHGEFFPFALNERQALSVEMTPTRFRYVGIKRSARAYTPPIIKASNLKIEDADAIDGGRPIKGSVTLRSRALHFGATFVFMRLEFQGPNYVAQRMAKLNDFRFDGKTEKTVEFELDPLNEPGKSDKPAHGAIPAFFSVIELSPDLDQNKTILYSNTLGTLLEVD